MEGGRLIRYLADLVYTLKGVWGDFGKVSKEFVIRSTAMSREFGELEIGARMANSENSGIASVRFLLVTRGAGR
jgi:hypothetical protein